MPVPHRRLRRKRLTHQRLQRLIAALCATACIYLGISFWVGPDEPKGGFRSIPPGALPVYLNGDWGAEFAGELSATTRTVSQKSGVEIALQRLPDNRDFFASVIRDRAIGVTSGFKFLLARWRGEPITAFGASLQDTSTIVVSLEKSGIRVPADIVGKRLGYQPGSEALVIYQAMMVQLGLPPSQVRLVPVSDLFGALLRSDVDAITTGIGELPVPLERDAQRLHVIKPQNYAIHVPSLVYFASSELVRDNPSTILDALRAMILGWQAAYADPELAIAALVTADPLRLTLDQVRFTLVQQRELVRPNGMRIGESDESRWKTLRDILLYSKLGEQTVPLSTAVNYKLVRDVYRRPLTLDSGAGRAGQK